ncbi:type II toxin-antitoxin system HicB family antitoxin [Thalassotalea euphylliae]|uniref:HicB family protein n=1 Tax=Thalassotalea euphylliae TaxID=1655234 RepID=A0A3E0UG24_9GAMM|nr:type II toxin-antitoxin system HicB family antitoxin [Thalassotalea euphylliae]REL35604.1 HicB family protein [Thalassotalea euphylliae]
MHYPVKFAGNPMSGYQVLVPDLPGCEVNCESIDQGLKKVKDAITAHLMILAEYGEPVPPASQIDKWLEKENASNAEDVGLTWAIIEIDVAQYLGKSHKINVTLPELLIKQIDDRVSKSEQYKTRSGFIAQACLAELAIKD